MLNDFSLLKPGMHIQLVPSDKTPELDRDIHIDDIVDWYGQSAILYNVSETCDGYVIPFSWIKSYKIVK